MSQILTTHQDIADAVTGSFSRAHPTRPGLATNGLRLLCLIENEVVVFPIDVDGPSWGNPKFIVADLKEIIQEKRKDDSLDGVGAHTLILWKPQDSINEKPKQTLCGRVASARASGEELGDMDSVLTVFPVQPLFDHIHIIVRKPDTDGPRLKRRRLSEPVTELEALQKIHETWLDFHKLWNIGLDNFLHQYVERSIDKSGANFRMMKTHPAFDLDLDRLLVRDEWDIAWQCAVKACDVGSSNFIIIGQTGIGKTLCLYYFLAKRLALGLTTLFQNTPKYVWLFNESGVHLIRRDIHWRAIDGFSKDRPAWALFDSNKLVQDPAPVLFFHSSPCFIVEASSPRKDRWTWTKYHGRTRLFYMNPFSLEEIIHGNLGQHQLSWEADLRDFFIQYGPSARECYHATTAAGGLDAYRYKLEDAIRRMSLDDIDDVVSNEYFQVKFDDDATSFLVVLIRPANEERTAHRATIITRTVMRLLWKAHQAQLKGKSRQLFHLFSKHSITSVAAGWLFETIIHDLLEEGIDTPFDPMVLEINTRPNAVHDKYVASGIFTNLRWTSSAMKYVPFTQNDCTLVIEPLHYYVPVDPSHPTYDSFTYELTSCAPYEGPILNPKNQNIYDKGVLDQNSEIGLFTVFQVTKADQHNMNEKCLNYICMIAGENRLTQIGIRFVGIIPAGKETIFKSPVAWREKLDTYSLPIVLQEPHSPPLSAVAG